MSEQHELARQWKRLLSYLAEIDSPLLSYVKVLAAQEWSSRTFTFLSMHVQLGLSSEEDYRCACEVKSVWVNALTPGHVTVRFKPKLVSPDVEVVETITIPEWTPELFEKIETWLFSDRESEMTTNVPSAQE